MIFHVVIDLERGEAVINRHVTKLGGVGINR